VVVEPRERIELPRPRSPRCQSSETGLPPTLTLELVESWETANLARRDADLALRHGVSEGGNLYYPKLA